jgi:hypothetical protein
MRHARTLLAALTASLVLAGAAQAQATLRYKFKEGEKLDYVIDQDQKMEVGPIEMKVNMTIDMTWETGKVDEQGNAEVKVKIARVKFAIDGPMGNIEIDSKDPKEADDLIGKIMVPLVKGMAEIEIAFTATPEGEMKDTKIPEKKIKKLKNIPGLGQMGDMLTPESFKTTVQGSILPLLPKDPIEKGKSWTQKTDQKTPLGAVSGKTTYTYEGQVEKGGKKVEKIAVVPEAKIDPDEKSEVKIKLKKMNSKGHAYFDPQAGRVLESTNETTAVAELEIAGMQLEVNTTQTGTVRLRPRTGSSEKSEKDKSR